MEPVRRQGAGTTEAGAGGLPPGAAAGVHAAPAAALPRAGGFARDAFVYGLGVVITRLVSFLMLPIYTRYLTPADYGVLQLLQITIDVTAIVLSAGLMTGVMRFYLKAHTEDERSAVISTAFLLLVATNAIGTLALLLAAPRVAALVLSGSASDGPTLVRIVAVTFSLESFVTVPLLLLQVLRKPVGYTVASLSKLALQLALNILLVVFLGWGAEGVLVGTLAATAALGSVLTPWMLRQTGLRFSRPAMRDLRRFGVPYQIATAGTFLLTFGDRFFLEASHGLAAVGIYGLAYQFGFLLSGLGAQPFFRAWSPQRLGLSTEPRALRDAAYARSFLHLNLIQITLAVGLALFIRPVLGLMSAPEFHAAASFVPVILAAFVLQAWTDAVALGIEVSEQTRYATFATWISVVAVLALYAALIPPLAGMGAAIATLLASALRFACTCYWSQSLWPVAWRFGPSLRLVAYAAVCVALSEAFGPRDTSLALASGCVLGLAYLGALLLDPLGADARLLLQSALVSPRRLLAAVRSRI